MLESIVTENGVYYGMAAFAGIGLSSKFLVSLSLKRLVKAGSDMSKSTHKFMKLVKAKFEHSCMANNGVENVGVFVDKYIHEYKVFGLHLHSWRKIQTLMLGLVAGVGIATAGGAYYQGIENRVPAQYGVVTVGMMLVMLASYHMVDENYRLSTLRIYMVDYLENVCQRRYKKAVIRQRAQTTEGVGVSQNTKVMEPVKTGETDTKVHNKTPNITTTDYVKQTRQAPGEAVYDNKGEVVELGGTSGITSKQAKNLRNAKITQFRNKTKIVPAPNILNAELKIDTKHKKVTIDKKDSDNKGECKIDPVVAINKEQNNVSGSHINIRLTQSGQGDLAPTIPLLHKPEPEYRIPTLEELPIMVKENHTEPVLAHVNKAESNTTKVEQDLTPTEEVLLEESENGSKKENKSIQKSSASENVNKEVVRSILREFMV